MRQPVATHLTERDLPKLAAPAKGAHIYLDDRQPGLAVRVTANGVRSFVAMYRARLHDGGFAQRKVTLGRIEEMTLDAARDRASDYRRAAKDGGDLRAVEEEKAAEQRRARKARDEAETVSTATGRFLKDHVDGKALRSAHISKLYIGVICDGARDPKDTDRIIVVGLGKHRMRELSRADVQDFLDELSSKRGLPYAFATFAHLRKFCNWYAAKDETFRNPVIKGMVDFTLKNLKRDRTLSDDELREVWKATEKVTPKFGAIARLLTLTGQRLNEIAAARLEWVNGDMLEIPASFYKTGTPHTVPLTPTAASIIKAQPRQKDAEFIFGKTGKTPFSGFSKAKAELDEVIAVARKSNGNKKPMPDWRLHDLRRTARSLMSRAGVPSDIAERVLGHVIGGVRGVYDRHAYLNEKREALEKLGKMIGSILDPSPASAKSNVVPLTRAKRKAVAGAA
jgi:integrase